MCSVNIKSFARIGFMGNPSDGFNGKTLSFLIKNFHAEVKIEPSESLIIQANPKYDVNEFYDLKELHLKTNISGYYGGVRLIKATCKAFYDLIIVNNLQHKIDKNFKISYETNIPQMVGLSGSSAIVLASFKCLLAYFQITIEDLKIRKQDLPQVILNIEKLELGISAGLQDRVVQVYGGLVHMDFSIIQFEKLGSGLYTKYDISMLPPLYLAYSTDNAGDSGKVHSTVKERWEKKDKDLCDGMNFLAQLADEALNCLKEKKYSLLADLMDKNFSLRRKLYTDEVVGGRNIAAVDLANKLGLSAKFTGSGGALVCLRRDLDDWLDVNQEAIAITSFASIGFVFCRIEPIQED